MMIRASHPIYMDHSATTPVHADVISAMRPFFAEQYGNPSSIHAGGRRAGVAIAEARRSIAMLIGATSREIIFTGCGTESDNAAVRGLALARRETTGANRIVTSSIEHKAVLYTAFDLRDHFGFEVTTLPVDGDGRVALEDVRAALGDDVAVVSIMLANNEIGTIQPIGEIGKLCRTANVPFHTDAVQAVGKIALNVDDLNVDALSASAHKFYGPKGVGFLYLRSGTPCLSFMTGGSHENNHRAGTENVPFVVGMAKALEICSADIDGENSRLRLLRDKLIGAILENVDGARLTGSADERISSHASFVIPGVEAEGVLISLDLAGVAAGSGSACTSGAQRPSHVLEAIGVPAIDAVGGLRLSLGHSTTVEDVEFVVEQLPTIVDRLRNLVPATL